LELTAIATCCAHDDRATALRYARTTFMQRFRSHPDRMIDTQRPEYREELLALKELVNRGEIERAQEQVSEPLATSFVAAGNGADMRRTLDDYFSAGCTRVIVAPFPRGRASAERLIRALAD
jgi:hypothetical protein